MGTVVSIDVYVMVHNEEAILPYFLRHYSSFAQHIYAFEDQSTDRSWEILNAHPLVTIIKPEIHGINEKYWTSTLWTTYEKLSRGYIDYVMLVDADEFIYHPNGIINVLTKEKERGTQVLHCQGYTMIADDFPETDEQIYCVVKNGLPDKLSNKWVVLDPKIHIRFTDGLHRIAETDAVALNSRSGLRLLHYRYLSAKYFEEKNKKNRDRFNIHDGVDREYSPDERHNLPDGSRGSKLKWYEEHKHEAVNVVDV